MGIRRIRISELLVLSLLQQGNEIQPATISQGLPANSKIVGNIERDEVARIVLHVESSEWDDAAGETRDFDIEVTAAVPPAAHEGTEHAHAPAA